MNNFMVKEACCFTGHSELTDEEVIHIKKRLPIDIQKMIDRGFKYFLCGGEIGFDTLAAKAVIELRKTNPQIKLILMLPCLDRDKDWTLEQKGDFALINIMCDEIIYTDEEYYEGCLFRRNCRLVNDSTVCIAYCKRSGQSEFTSRFARLNGLEVINLAD